MPGAISTHRISDKPRIAVLMAAWNGMPWIGEQIDSIFAQRHVDLELFVSIDPGTDSTADYIRGRAQNNTRINILPEVSPFGCAAHNFYRLLRDVDIQHYDYISLADQDDCWKTDKLWRACTILAHTEAVAYSGAVTAFWHNGREKKLQKAQPQRELDFLFEAAGPGCTYVFEREFALELQHLLQNKAAQIDSIRAHDWFFYAFCRSRGYRWYIDPQSYVLYRQHPGNELGANCGLAGIQRRVKMLRLGWYGDQIRQVVSICNMQDDPVIKHVMSDSWRDRFLSLKHIHKLRRRFRDRCLLALLVLSGQLKNEVNKS